jgi:NAD(P)H dehydrogenase (quinone)
MPRLLVLFHARSAELAPLVDAVADGARSVRFAEVDVRSLGEGPDPTSRKPLERIEDLASYDAIIVGVGSGQTVESVMESLGRFDGSLADKVGSAFTARSGADRAAALWSALSTMADRGMILVPLPFAEGRESEADACRRMGKRVADVVGWVTHARSHHHHH